MMSPAGGGHGRIAMRIGFLLEMANDRTRAGRVYAAETGFVIERDPDTVRAPDAAFVKQALVDQIVDESKYLPFAPTLAVEVISSNDTFSEVEQKAQQWLASGTEGVLLIDPTNQQVHLLRRRGQSRIFSIGETLDLSDLIPNCIFSVAAIFT